MNLQQNIFRILKATSLAACLTWGESSFAVGGEKPGEDHSNELVRIPVKPSFPPKPTLPTDQRKLMHTTIQAFSLNGQSIISTTDVYEKGNVLKTEKKAYPAKPPVTSARKKFFMRKRMAEFRKNRIRTKFNKTKNQTPTTRRINNNETIQMAPISFAFIQTKDTKKGK